MKTQPDQNQMTNLHPVDGGSCPASGLLVPRTHSSGDGQAVSLDSESVAGEEDPGASLDMAAAIVCPVDNASAEPLSASPPPPGPLTRLP